MTRSETFRGDKNAKALPTVPLGFRPRKQVRPGHADHVGGALLVFRTPWHHLLSFSLPPNTQLLLAVYRNRACICFPHFDRVIGMLPVP